jgi:hypothetical protein
MLALATLKG